MSSELAYSQYLRSRSTLGRLYRRHWLYPKLNKYLSGRILDYGCGIGDFLLYRANTVGVDINKHNIAYCIALGREALLIEANSALPFPDHTFSGAILDNVLEHIPRDFAGPTLREVARVVRPGGNLIIGVPGEKGYHSDPDHKVMYTQRSLIALASKYGFTVQATFFMPLNFRALDRYITAHCLYAVFKRDAFG